MKLTLLGKWLYSPLSFRRRSGEETARSYFARGTFIYKFTSSGVMTRHASVDDKKVADLNVETWSVYTSCSKSPRNDIWEFECSPLRRRWRPVAPMRTDRTSR